MSSFPRTLAISSTVLVAAVLAGCGAGNDSSSDTTAVAETTTANTKAAEAIAASTTDATPRTSPPATAAQTTTEVPYVPAEVQAAYLEAGQPELTDAQYDRLTEVCQGLMTDSAYQTVFWSEDRSDVDREQILTTVRPLCPEAEEILNAATPVRGITDGTYLVGEEMATGWYRVAGYWSMLDDDLEIIANDGFYENGLGLMNLIDTVAYIEISGEAITTDDFAESLEEPLAAGWPIERGYTDGTYLVNFDIEPGRYRVSDPDYAFAAVLDLDPAGGWDTRKNVGNGGSVVIDVPADAVGFAWSGTIEMIG